MKCKYFLQGKSTGWCKQLSSQLLLGAYVIRVIRHSIPPALLEVDEVSFKKPVDIGDLLRLKSRVLHTSALSDNKVMSG